MSQIFVYKAIALFLYILKMYFEFATYMETIRPEGPFIAVGILNLFNIQWENQVRIDVFFQYLWYI